MRVVTLFAMLAFTFATAAVAQNPRPRGEPGQQFERRGEKSPAVAGILSAVLPGAGSLYAGSTGHGIRHLVMIPGIIGATWLGLEIANKDSGEAEAAEYAVLVGGAALLLANGIWSVFTAVDDAHDHNRAVRLGRLRIEPGVRALAEGRLGVTIAHLSF